MAKGGKDGGLGVSSEPIFGGSLVRHCELTPPLPPVVVACCQEVEKRGLDSQGIYRISGNTSLIQKLKSIYNHPDGTHSPADMTSDYMDINAVAGLLKLYFRELINPLIPFELYDEFILAAKIPDYNDRLCQVKTLVQALPPAHYDVLKYLMAHLAKVASMSDMNKMEPSNIAIVFGPTLVRANESDTQSAYANMMNMAYHNSLVEQLVIQQAWLFDGSTD